MEIKSIGIDLGKTVFHLVGVNARGEVVVRKKCSGLPTIRLLRLPASQKVPIQGFGSHRLAL